MKTSDTANSLNTYLVTRSYHPEKFDTVEKMNEDVSAIASAISNSVDVASPFILACHLLDNTQLWANLDAPMLANSCRNLLSTAPIDEVSAEAVDVYARFISSADMQIDRQSHASTLAGIYIRAADLDEHDAVRLKGACSNAFKSMRRVDMITPEIERGIDKRLSREVAIGFVQDLGFAQSSLQSLKNWRPADSSPPQP